MVMSRMRLLKRRSRCIIFFFFLGGGGGVDYFSPGAGLLKQ